MMLKMWATSFRLLYMSFRIIFFFLDSIKRFFFLVFSIYWLFEFFFVQILTLMHNTNELGRFWILRLYLASDLKQLTKVLPFNKKSLLLTGWSSWKNEMLYVGKERRNRRLVTKSYKLLAADAEKSERWGMFWRIQAVFKKKREKISFMDQ